MMRVDEIEGRLKARDADGDYFDIAGDVKEAAEAISYLLAEVKRLDDAARRAQAAVMRAVDHGLENEAIALSLAEALDRALEWIDAVPAATELPAMPGFDRDEVDNLRSDQRLDKIRGK